MLTTNAVVRPDRIQEKVKDRAYHEKYAQYILARSLTIELQRFRMKYMLDQMFYRADDNNKWQWIFDEDLETFLSDESGGVRYRIKVQDNIINPIVRHYIGNAIRGEWVYRVSPITENVANRRDDALNNVLGLGEIANSMGGHYKDMIGEQYPIGESASDTEALFNTYYRDDLIKGINDLISVVKSTNEIDTTLKRWCAEELATCGLAVVHNEEHNGKMKFTAVPASNFIWDVAAKKLDLSDASFMGHLWYAEPVDLFETYQDLTDDDRQNIEAMANWQNQGQTYYNAVWTGNNTGRVTVYKIYWKDAEQFKYGVVRDEFGYEIFTRIDAKDGEDGKSKYTEADLVANPQTPKYKAILKGKKYRRTYVDVLRYCVLVYGSQSSTGDDTRQIILEYGMEPYQEVDFMDPSNVKFPYSVCAFKLWNGTILSPIDPIIGFQRVINRYSSALEEQVNRATPPITMIGRELLDDEGEANLRTDIRNGNPVLVNSRFGLNNAIAQLSGTRLDGIQFLNNVIGTSKMAAQALTGVNENMLGTGSEELVRNTQAMIQRGTLMQEDFYDSLGSVIRQMYQSIATRGRRIYADSPHNLAMSVGDDNARRIIFSKDSLLEDFRIDVERSRKENTLIEEANGLLLQMLQMQLIDEENVSRLLNVSTPDEVYAASRRYLKMKQITKVQAAQQQNMVDQQYANQELQLKQAAIDVNNKTSERAAEMATEKNKTKIAGDLIKLAGSEGKNQSQPTI